MSRALLRTPGVRPPAGTRVMLDDDSRCARSPVAGCGPAPSPEVTVGEPRPRLEVRLRERTGFDDEGTPLFGWRTVAAGIATLYETRVEHDDLSGTTLVRARAVLSNDQRLTQVPETAVVVDPGDGTMWSVQSADVHPDRFEFTMTRVEGPSPDRAEGDGMPRRDVDRTVTRGDDFGPMLMVIREQVVDDAGRPVLEIDGRPRLGDPVDLTDATVIAQVRTSTAPDAALVATFDATVLDQTASATRGRIRLALTAETTGGIEPGRYRYDVQVTRNGRVTTYLAGWLTVEGDVSHG